eukprot:COSAG01_NODE_69059_length_262_cov_0.950920_1_plen_42_part_10
MLAGHSVEQLPPEIFLLKVFSLLSRLDLESFLFDCMPATKAT